MTAPSQEEQYRKLYVELQMMQSSAETLQQRLQMLQSATADLRVGEESLKGLRDAEEGAPILVPTGGGTFVNANLGDLSKVIVGIGADVSIDMDLEEAEENVSDRLEEVDKASRSVQQQLEQILAQMQVHQDGLNRIRESLRGEAPGV